MSSQPLPNEIFAKIVSYYMEKASHTDMKNLQKAVYHPDFDHYHETFEHITSRSRQESTEDGNFICPVCLFSQKDIYEDSVWDELCQKVFGCHFVLFGANQLAKTRRVRTGKRKISPSIQKSTPSNKYILKFIFSQELMLKESRQKSLKKCPNYPFTLSYIRKIHFSKGCKNTMDGISRQLGNLTVFTDVGEFINHLNDCTSHYHKPSIKTRCDDDHSDINCLDYDHFYKMKVQGKPIHELSTPREKMRNLTRDNNACMFDLISLKQPDPNLFDGGSQNHDFLELILWPILTFAISLQLEDHITFPTSQFKTVSQYNRQALALRDLLRNICEVSENIEYDFDIDTWVKAKFAALHGMLEILDSFFPEY